tara:strand:+ start:1983 stop:2411 length:429 start_codon:yes stop_codon:yes gene_type:complete
MKRALNKVLPLTLSTLLIANQASGFVNGGDAGASRSSGSGDDGGAGCNPYPKGTTGIFHPNYLIGERLTEKIAEIMEDKMGVPKQGSLFHGAKGKGRWYVEKPNVYKSTITQMPNWRFLVETSFNDGRKYRGFLTFNCGDKK